MYFSIDMYTGEGMPEALLSVFSLFSILVEALSFELGGGTHGKAHQCHRHCLNALIHSFKPQSATPELKDKQRGVR